MTQRAFGVLLAGVALIVLQLLISAAPLLIIGPAFVLLGVLTLAFVLAASRSAHLGRRPLPARAVEDQPLEVVLEVRLGRLGAPGAVIVDPLLPEPMELPDRRGSHSTELRFDASLARRGLYPIEVPALELSDPLRLVRARKLGDGQSQPLLVLPRTEPVRWRQERGAPVAPTRARSTLEPLAAVDVDGLRPYRPGAPASRIHWQALARGAGLLERRMRSDGHQLPLVMLDPRSDGPPEQLDQAVRAAASLILELASAGGCRALVGGDRRASVIGPELASWPALHARLALLEGGVEAPVPTIGSERMPGGVIYVAARALDGPPRALARAAGTRTLVLPSGLDDAMKGTPSFEVAGCRGYLLRAAVSRVAA